MAFWRNSSLSSPANTKATASKTLKHFDSKSAPSHYHTLALRHNQHKHLLKGLGEYYTQLKDQYLQSAKDFDKIGDSLPLPFHESQFLGPNESGGWQHALYLVKERTKAVAATYSELAKEVDRAVISPLVQARDDIKTFLKTMDSDMGKLTNDVDRCREESAAALNAHDTGISISESGQHSASTAKQDPFVTNGVAALYLQQQAELDNQLTRTILSYQKLSFEAEIKMTKAIQDASKAFLDIQLGGDVRLKLEFAAIEEAVSSVSAKNEWTFFESDNSRVLSPQTNLHDTSSIFFPQQDHASIQPVLTGQLERQKGITRSWAPFYFVLTQAGFLHQYPPVGLESLTDPKEHLPALSIFLSDFTLSDPSPENDPKGIHRFTLFGARGSATGKDSKQGIVGSLGLGKATEVGYTFQAKDHSTLLDWHEAMRKYARPSSNSTPIMSPRSVSGASSFFDESMTSPALDQDQASTFDKIPDTPTQNPAPKPAVLERQSSGYGESITEPDSPGKETDNFQEIEDNKLTEAPPPVPARRASPAGRPVASTDENASEITKGDAMESNSEEPKSDETDKKSTDDGEKGVDGAEEVKTEEVKL